MKLKVYYKNIVQNILHTKARFISIFIIVFLGASFFAGLQHAPHVMYDSIDSFIEKKQYNDLRYLGTMGFTKDDIRKLAKISGIKTYTYGNQFDALMTYQKEADIPIVVRTKKNFQENIDKVEITKGRLPQNDQEIIINSVSAKSNKYKLNKIVTLTNNQGTKQYRIVGLFKSGDYIADLYDTNSISDTNNVGYAFVLTAGNEQMAIPQSLRDLRGETIYTNIAVKITGRDNIFSDEYRQKVKRVDKVIKKQLQARYNKLYQELITKAKEQINEANSSYYEGEAKYQAGLSQYNNAKKSYDTGYSQYLAGLSQYKAGQQKYQQALWQYDTGYQQYLKGYQQYQVGLKQYQTNLAHYQASYQEYQINLTEYQNNLALVNQYDQELAALNQQEPIIDQYRQELADLNTQLANTTDEAEKARIQAQINVLNEKIRAFETAKAALTSQSANIEALRAVLPTAKAKLDEAKTALTKAENELAAAKAELDNSNQKLIATKSQLDSARDTLARSKQQLDNMKILLANSKISLDQGKNQLDASWTELEKARVELAEGKQKIQDAQDQVTKLKQGTIYTLTHEENTGLVTFKASGQSIEALALVFPLIFFLVAALVSLTTMTRMVEEQRVKGGTLRSLGYSKKQVIREYMIYAFLATAFASVLGIIGGVYFFPSIIYYLYSLMLFEIMAPTVIIFRWGICLITFVVAVVLIMAITYSVCHGELKELPAALLRPKAPRAGKRILLERVSFIWRRLSFNYKVTARNIFRYKKRFFMSVVGIAGCTALIVMAFGLTASIKPIVNKQFAFWHFDATVSYDKKLDQASIEEANLVLEKEEYVKRTMLYAIKQIKLKTSYVSIYIPQNLERFAKTFILRDYQTGKKLSLADDGVIISQKIAELLNKKAGDTLEISIDDIKYKVKIKAIAKNYFLHYMYFSSTYYQKITDNRDIKYLYATVDLINSKAKNKLEKYVNTNTMTSGVTYTRENIDLFNQQLNSINSVVIILITMAAVLNFVVLYNLTNINIQERKNEIATIKVLGFYKKETADYIFRENYFLAIFGMLFGLVLGNLLHRYVILSVELEQLVFIRTCPWWVYLVAAVLTLFFTLIINKIMTRSIYKIDMVESLKSGE